MPDLSAQIEQAASEPQSASTDGRSATAVPLPALIEADKYLKAADALSGTNANGGPKSAWGRTRIARAVPPGGA